MILPNNGKVVIIDNDINDVKDLMAALSAEKVPFVYYQDENGEDLPPDPLENVRLIFLDLKLVDNTENQPPKKIIAPIAVRLKRILTKNNGPYVLIYWSNKEDEYRKPLEKEFLGSLKEYKPLLMLSLKKNNSLPDIKKEMESKFTTEFGALNAFLFWESMVNNSGGNVVNDFAGFILPSSNLDVSLKNILYKLAKAIDKQGISTLQDSEKIKKAFSAINSVLLDSLVTSSENSSWPAIVGIAEPSSGNPKYLAQIHTKLHLRVLATDLDKKSLSCGNVYVLRRLKKNQSVVQKMVDKNIGKQKQKIKNSATLIMLDVSPPCDYAQGGVECVRLLPGILFEYDPVEKDVIKNNEVSYGNCPNFYINNKVCGISFDFRFVESQPKDIFIKKSLPAKYRLGMELMADIQAKLARHINRPGIVSIE